MDGLKMIGEWYYCDQCGAVFPADDMRVITFEECHWWLDDRPTETWHEWLCPECGSAAVEECEYCDGCGDALRPDQLIDGFCEQCRKEVEEGAFL